MPKKLDHVTVDGKTVAEYLSRIRRANMAAHANVQAIRDVIARATSGKHTKTNHTRNLSGRRHGRVRVIYTKGSN